MKIQSVEFVGSFGHPQPLPRDQRPEVVLFGRSNVGKSSLINTLLGRHGVARISKTPGKTRSANFFRINDRFYLIDMPGYGYAKASRSDIERMTRIYDQYIAADDRRNALIQILDIRHEPTAADQASVARLSNTSRPLCLVFNKSDKVKASQLNRRIGESLRLLEANEDTAVIPFSNVTGAGKRELWSWVQDVLKV